LVGNVTTSDVDAGDGTLYSLVDNAGGRFSIDSGTGDIRVLNSSLLNYENATSHSIIVQVIDSAGASYQEAFTVTLTDVDEFDLTTVVDNNPTLNSVDENSLAGTTVGVTALGNDLDGTAVMTYSLTDDAGGRFTIDTNTGVVEVVGGLDFETNSSHTITVFAQSDDGSSASGTFVIQVNDVNETPDATVDNYSTNAGTTLNFNTPGVLVNDNDVDGDGLTAVIVTTATSGTLTLNADGSLTYIPNAGFVGIDTFYYQASDGSLLSAPVEVQIDVVAGGGGDPGDGGDGGDGGDSDGSGGPGDPGDPGPDGGGPGTDDDDDGTDDSVAETTETAQGTTADEGTSARSLQSVKIQSVNYGTSEPIEMVVLEQRELVGLRIPQSEIEIELFDRLLQMDLAQSIVWQDWDQADLYFGEATIGAIVESAGTAAGLFSVGFVLWAFRAGTLMTALSSEGLIEGAGTRSQVCRN
jgi:hypothetical protein